MQQFSLEDGENNEVNRPWYDTTEGIMEKLETLSGFNELISERYRAGYKRGERMNEFLVMQGRFSLDTCGNIGRFDSSFPTEKVKDFPDVLERKKFWELWNETVGDRGMSFSMADFVPPERIVCPVCGKNWTIDDCFDVIRYSSTKNIPMTDYVGQSLATVKKAFYERTDAVYFTQPDLLLRNDRFIDLTSKYPCSEDSWEKKQVVNARGWVGSQETEIDDTYIIQEGDELFFNVWTYHHNECNRKRLHREQEEKFRELFTSAGFKDLRLSAIQNEYCACNECPPWFNVNTEFGTIKIGWRKRVVNIDWSSLIESLRKCGELPNRSISSLFEDESVTKGENSIHAWGYDNVTEYLTKIYNFVKNN